MRPASTGIGAFIIRSMTVIISILESLHRTSAPLGMTFVRNAIVVA